MRDSRRSKFNEEAEEAVYTTRAGNGSDAQRGPRMKANRNGQALPRCLDLFCGIGGLTLGLEKAGLQCVGGIDIWEDAQVTFDHNLARLRCMVSDLTKATTAEIESFFGISVRDIDVLSGGPPCQGFSTVGKRDESDPRNALWRHYREMVAEIRPAYVLIENVEGMLVVRDGELADEVIASFGEIGYHMKCKLLRTADYGIPQLRKRTIFLGWLDGLVEPDFPARTRDSFVTVADAIFDLPALEPGQKVMEYDKPTTTDYQKARRKGVTLLANHEAANHPPHLVEVLKHIPDGGNRKSIPDHLQPKSGFHNSYARLASFKPAIAVTSNMRKPSSARATHPTQHRGLTVREGLRLQSFDDDFVVLGSRTSQYVQVGNAVPPLLGLALGREILKAFQANDLKSIRAARERTARPVLPEAREGSQLSLF
jgi:DNA (cytosine-5)-methyltransferase 1